MEAPGKQTQRGPPPASHNEAELGAFLEELCRQATSDASRDRAMGVISQLMDRRYALGGLKRSRVLAALDQALDRLMHV